MTGPAGVVDYFAIEAGEYLDRLDQLLAAASHRGPEPEPFGRAARALRGAATMARHAPLADLAAGIELAGGALRDGRLAWGAAASDALVAAVDGYKALLRRVRSWTDAESAAAAARTAELRALAAHPAAAAAAPRQSAIVPVATLFYDDDGPHVVQRNPSPPITADLRFRQAAVPLASTLRRLIGDARHAADDAARRAVGDDLRGAIRDLGELAASYDIRPVLNFARAREDALARLDERALDTVDGAAQALIESAGTTWARPTPPSGVPVASPRPAPAAATTPEAPETPPAPAAAPAEPARATPPSGRALVALLETSITGIHQFSAELVSAPAASAPAPSAPSATEAAGVVPIESLVYRGRAALDRARELRDRLRAAPAPDPALLDELYDLLDLAADEPGSRVTAA